MECEVRASPQSAKSGQIQAHILPLSNRTPSVARRTTSPTDEVRACDGANRGIEGVFMHFDHIPNRGKGCVHSQTIKDAHPVLYLRGAMRAPKRGGPSERSVKCDQGARRIADEVRYRIDDRDGAALHRLADDEAVGTKLANGDADLLRVDSTVNSDNAPRVHRLSLHDLR